MIYPRDVCQGFDSSSRARNKFIKYMATNAKHSTIDNIATHRVHEVFAPYIRRAYVKTSTTYEIQFIKFMTKVHQMYDGKC